MTLLFSLVGGLLVAIALQLVFANLGIALGLSVLDWSPETESNDPQSEPKKSDSEKSDSETSDPKKSDLETKQSLSITHFLGFGVALGFSFTTFSAALLSVEFSQIIEPRRGIIFGLIVWATYWLLFIWLSSTTISGIADSLLGSALKGGKQLLATVKKTAQTFKDNDAATDTPTGEYIALQKLMAEVSRLAHEQKQIPALLAHQRDTLLAELSVHGTNTVKTNHADSPANNSDSPDNLNVETIVDASSAQPSVSTEVSTTAPTLFSQLDLPSWQQILRRTLNQVDLSDWDMETILQQLPIDKEKVTYAKSQLVASAKNVLPHSDTSDDVVNGANLHPQETHSSEPSLPKVSEATIKAIQTKLIAYCRYTNTDLLTPENLIDKVQAQQEEYGLSQAPHSYSKWLDIGAIEAILNRRQKLSKQKKKQLVEALRQAWPVSSEEDAAVAIADIEKTEAPTERSRQASVEDSKKTVLSEADLSASGVAVKAYEALENYFQAVDWAEVSLEDIKPEITMRLEQVEQNGAIAQLDWQALSSRIQLPERAKAEFTTWLQTACQHKVNEVYPAVAAHTRNLSQQLAEKITHFLHHQQKTALTPDNMAQSLTQAVGGAIATLPHPSTASSLLAHKLDVSSLWHKATWQQALEKRQDLTPAEIEQVLAWGESTWQPKAQQIGSWLQAIQAEARKHISLPDADVLTQPVAHAAQQAVGQLVAQKENILEQAGEVKENIAGQIDGVKADIQQQADVARGQVAIAAWWLFIALVSSGTAAAEAGYLAASY